MNEKDWMDYCINLQRENSIFEQEYKKRAAEGKMGVISRGGKGNIPVLHASGNGRAEAWENAMVCLWTMGGFVRTQYDRKEKENDSNSPYIVPPSKDSTMIWVIENPLSEPGIHRDFPGGLNDLEEYDQEVNLGIKDSWIRDPKNPADHRWEYTYHERERNYAVPGAGVFDQIQMVIDNLKKSPITRRAQIVTWKVWEDAKISDPACFQSLWPRILREHPQKEFEFYSDEFTGKPKMNVNIRFRSWDAYKASFMNMYAFTNQSAIIAREVSRGIGEEIGLARICCMGDSFHIYGDNFEEFLNRFGKSLKSRKFLEDPEMVKQGKFDQQARTYDTRNPEVQAIFDEARKTISAKVAEQTARYAQGKDLTKDSSKIFKT